MGRDHFAQYAKAQPKEYRAFSDSMWNSFVTVTHAIGLNRFFTFTPDLAIFDNPVKDGEAVGAALGKIFQFSQGIEEDKNYPL
jgi:hypothetical protein